MKKPFYYRDDDHVLYVKDASQGVDFFEGETALVLEDQTLEVLYDLRMEIQQGIISIEDQIEKGGKRDISDAELKEWRRGSKAALGIKKNFLDNALTPVIKRKEKLSDH